MAPDAGAATSDADADAVRARGDAARTKTTERTNEGRSSDDGSKTASGDASLRAVLDALVRARLTEDATGGRDGSNAPEHAFWETQPVRQFGEKDEGEAAEGAIDAGGRASERAESAPPSLPPGYEWCSCDMRDEETQKEVYELLTNNYVEDDDAMFRFQYSKEFLKWALCSPGYHLEWHVGVRLRVTNTLVAIITGVPARVNVKGKEIDMAEINFLCIHKKLRSKRIAPTLIREITRRVNAKDVWQAAYTAGVVLPKPIARARYWHRSLDIKKLVEIGFTRLSRDSSMSRAVQVYKLDPKPKCDALRRMLDEDVPQVTALLSKYLSSYSLAPVMSEADVRHWLMPRDGVVFSYVVENENGKITDFISFYNLPSQIIHERTKHKELKAAYSYYNVATSMPLVDLMADALILAKCNDFDVFNTLDLMENASFLEQLKFGKGDGNLHYYLYNWRLSADLEPSQVALVLT